MDLLPSDIIIHLISFIPLNNAYGISKQFNGIIKKDTDRHVEMINYELIHHTAWKIYITILEIRELPMLLSNIHRLTLSKCCDLVDATCLSNINTIILDRCDELETMGALTNVVDLTIIGGINFTDHKYIPGLRNVKIITCDISNVEMYKDVEFIVISRCHYLSDISPLKNTRTVILDMCHCISDISQLASVESITISDCRNITVFDNLTNTINLTLCYYCNIDISALLNLQKLLLIYCNKIKTPPYVEIILENSYRIS